MVTTQTKEPQGLLFSEPSIAETGVWCTLADGIDPAEWAYICRYVGSLGPREFTKLKKRVFGNPDSVLVRLKRVFVTRFDDSVSLPLVSIGPGKLGTEYKWEMQP